MTRPRTGYDRERDQAIHKIAAALERIAIALENPYQQPLDKERLKYWLDYYGVKPEEADANE